MRPSPRLLTMLALLWLASLLLRLADVSGGVSDLFIVFFVCVITFDGVQLWRRPRPSLKRQLPAIVSVKTRFQTRLTLCWGTAQSVEGVISEQCPESCEVLSPHSLTITLEPGEQSAAFELLSRQRGAVHWERAQWTDSSALGLWKRRSQLPCESSLSVYPDYARSRRQLTISLSKSLRALGVVRRHRAGESQEFHQLRAYQPGDSLRRIDWKATSRRGQLIARQYAEESNQSLVFMLDCGRRMGLKAQGRELLDEALDATLMAAEIALRHGDRVSVQCFAAQPLYWSGENKTPQAVNNMLAQLHTIHSRAESSNFEAAALAVRKVLKKNSTIVLVTHSRNESTDEINTAARLLAAKHQVVVADIADGELAAVLAEEPSNFDRALSYCGALNYQQQRSRSHRQLREMGAEVVDVAPRQLVNALVQAYYSRRQHAA